LAIAAIKDFEIAQFDIKTAFLNRNIFEEIYMIVSEGPSQMVKYANFRNSYIASNASRVWNHEFNLFLKWFNFEQTK